MKAPYLRLPKLLAFFVAVSVIGGGLVVTAGDLAPELFAPGVISTDLDETSGSFSPDGQAFYFARWAPYTTAPAVSVICVSYLRNGQWTPAQVVPFSGTYLDGSPFIAPDGKRLYFASKRPTHSQTNTSDWNIWFVERQGNSWSEPQEIGPPVNTPHRESNPTVARDGTLYFVSDRDSQPGYSHIFRARLSSGHFNTPERLGPEINGGEADTNPFISPDGRILIFVSYSRKDTLRDGGNLYPRGDLYLSVNRDGQWTPARHLEHGINTTASDGNPTMSPDGKWFYFTSERSPFEIPMKQKLTTASWKDRQQTIENGIGNIYRIPAAALELNR